MTHNPNFQSLDSEEGRVTIPTNSIRRLVLQRPVAGKRRYGILHRGERFLPQRETIIGAQNLSMRLVTLCSVQGFI